MGCPGNNAGHRPPVGFFCDITLRRYRHGKLRHAEGLGGRFATRITVESDSDFDFDFDFDSEHGGPVDPFEEIALGENEKKPYRLRVARTSESVSVSQSDSSSLS